MYRLLLSLVHLICWCYETVALLLVLVRKKYDALWARSELAEDFAHISDIVRSVKNIPSHLAFILVDEQIVSVHDLANVVIWSFAAGISFLTFYDQDGLFIYIQNNIFINSIHGQFIILAPLHVKWCYMPILNAVQSSLIRRLI